MKSSKDILKDTFKDIDEFIIEAFPLEYDKIIKQRQTPIERSIKTIDSSFAQELEKIMKGEDSKKK
jgi:hypothetical protein